MAPNIQKLFKKQLLKKNKKILKKILLFRKTVVYSPYLKHKTR